MKTGSVYLIGAGPGDPDLLTVKAARLLAAAEIVLHDDLVPAAVLALANPRAVRVSVGKRCGTKNITQEQINQLMIEHARQGQNVVRLKSGDPLVFGRAAEEMDALRRAGVAFEIVPGITAAFAAAAALQCSLTDRRAASGIVFRSGHHAPDATAAHVHDPAAATRLVYMPGRDFTAIAAEWRAEGLPLDFPCVAISRAAQPDQQVAVTTLAALPATEPGPAPVLLLAGWVFAELRIDMSEIAPLIQSALAEIEAVV